MVMRWEAGVVSVALLYAKRSQRGASSSGSLFSGNVCHLVLKYILGSLNSNDVMWLISLNSVVGI